MQRLSRMDIWLDPSSLLPTAVAFNTHPDNNAFIDISNEIRFSDYQAFSGVAVPLHIQKFLNNSLALDLQLSNPSLNSGLSSSVFQIP